MDNIKLGVLMLVHPIKANIIIKRHREQFSIFAVLILFFLAVLTRVLALYFTHYSVASIRPEEANLLLEVAVVLIPIITWFVSNYALTSIMGGSAKATEALTGIAYAYLPYIVINLAMTAVSQILSSKEIVFFLAMQMLAVAWQVFLLFVSMKSLNDFTMGKALFVSLISVIGIAIVWGLFLLAFALSSQVLFFIRELAAEIHFMR